ncbi:MAG: molecular chaperone, partial [Lachnospiraceae bacterium]|nr:molecular chaperone [Lachnospiraceae bacterium]
MRYHREALELMTTFQLGEICRTEKLVLGMLDPLDKEALIKVILRFRGADEVFLVRKHDPSGMKRLAESLVRTKLQEKDDLYISCHSKITVYKDLAMGFYDRLTVPYDRAIAGTNALVIGGDGKLCAILNVEAKGDDTTCLYLTKSAEMPVEDSEVKRYSLYCFEHQYSELLYQLYTGEETHVPEYIPAYRTALLDFEVRQPVNLVMPLAMDFGTTNTTAGVYLDSVYFEAAGLSHERHGLKENEVNYIKFYDVTKGWQETVLLHSVVSVLSVGLGENKLLFGYAAEQLAESSYVDEGFCVFYDIKRWIGDYEKVEEITDREGHRGFLKRKDILKEYLEYIINEAANQFKCHIEAVHISCPVKQKA